jgi:hypothetical protein
MFMRAISTMKQWHMTSAMNTSRPRMLYKQPDLLPLDQAVFSAGQKPGFFTLKLL